MRGAKIVDTDPDMGALTYVYNTLGLPVSQTDAKGQTVSLAYDKLDRVIQRVEPDKTSSWTYDTAAPGLGKLAATAITAGAGAGYSRNVVYDALSRPTQVGTTIDGATYNMTAAYDANGTSARSAIPPASRPAMPTPALAMPTSCSTTQPARCSGPRTRWMRSCT